MPLDLPKLRAWARKGHQYDDAALAMSWDAAKAELEKRTGWVLDPVTRTQYVAEAPDGDESLVRLERQPVTAVTVVDSSSVTQTLPLTLINGIYFVGLSENSGGTAITLDYPVQLTVSCGTSTIDPLLEMALMQRAVEIEASRGDDTVALPGAYWDRICKMYGKGIG